MSFVNALGLCALSLPVWFVIVLFGCRKTPAKQCSDIILGATFVTSLVILGLWAVLS